MTEHLIGTKVGHYRIVDRIAAGGMGEVYVGHDETLQRRVALKRIRPEFHLSELAKARFQREARVLSQLGHPNICQIYNYLEGGESDFIVMELVEGRSLSQAMKAGLDARTKARVAEQVAGVLVAAHGKGVVHRDLKPDNVMLAAGDQVKVLDFGLSRQMGDEAWAGSHAPPLSDPAEGTAALEEGATRSLAKPSGSGTPQASQEKLTTVGAVMGTVGYMSPEQARGEATTAASDIYSFGLMLQELVTGRRAYEPGLKGAARLEIAKLGETLPVTGIDKDLAALIARLKSVEPAARPSAIDVAEKLEWIQRKPQRRRRRMALAAGVAAVVLVAIALGGLLRQAVIRGHQTEAAQLLSLGRLSLIDHPNAALAYAIASIERSDSGPARRFAVEALAQGPPALYLESPVLPASFCWSRAGDRLAVGGMKGLEVVNRDTGERRLLISTAESPVGFTEDGRRLVTLAPIPWAIHIWALPEGRLERTIEPPKDGNVPLPFPFLLRGNDLLTSEWGDTQQEDKRMLLIHRQSLDGASDQLLGGWATETKWDWDIDPDARWFVFWQGGRVCQQRLDALSAPPRVLSAQEAGWVTVTIRPWLDRAVTSDRKGNVRIWHVPSGRVERELKSPASASEVGLDPTGRFVATGCFGPTTPHTMFLFDLSGPPTAEPSPLCTSPLNELDKLGFSPDGAWLASDTGGVVILWNMAGSRPLVLGRQAPPMVSVAFSPDGHLLSASNEGVLRSWPLSQASGEGVRVLWSQPSAWINFGSWIGFGGGEVDGRGRYAVLAIGNSNEILKVPLDGSPVSTFRLRPPPGSGFVTWVAQLDPSGRFVALVIFCTTSTEESEIHLLDLSTGIERTLDKRASSPPVWLPDGRLVTEGDSGLRVRDVVTGASTLLGPRTEYHLVNDSSLSRDSRTIVNLAQAAETGATSVLTVLDIASRATREITSHGKGLRSFVLDSTGKILVTGDLAGVVRVGPISGEEPHLLFGHVGQVTSVAVSPDGKWIASGSDDGTIRLWPMPDLSKPPLHTLPHDELLAKLKALTNLRAVRDPASDTGWKIDIGPFPGWAHVPEWQP